MSWGFIGGAAASANGLNNPAVSSGEKNYSPLPCEISVLVFGAEAWWSLRVLSWSSCLPELSLTLSYGLNT